MYGVDIQPGHLEQILHMVLSDHAAKDFYSLCGIPIFSLAPCFCWFVSYFLYIGTRYLVYQKCYTTLHHKWKEKNN